MDLQNRLKDFIKTKKRTISSVAKAMDISTATLHLWMNNKYEGNVKKVTDAVTRFLEIEELREGRVSLDFVKTTVADDVFDIAKTCHVENEIGVCYGEAGIGKTFAVKRYKYENAGVVLIEADLGYRPKVLFSEIHKKLGFDGHGTVHSMMLDIIDKLKSSGRLIIVDEAEHLPYTSLELLRRIYDKAEVGILLVGMPRLMKNLKGDKKEYAQLYSRVGIKTELNPLTDEDKVKIISKLLPNQDSLITEILADFLQQQNKRFMICHTKTYLSYMANISGTKKFKEISDIFLTKMKEKKYITNEINNVNTSLSYDVVNFKFQEGNYKSILAVGGSEYEEINSDIFAKIVNNSIIKMLEDN